MGNNPYLPNQGLQIGNAFAQGVKSFMTAYQGAQDRQHKQAVEDEQLAMKRQYYELQMQKVKKEVEPVDVNMIKFMAAKSAAEKGFVDPSIQKMAAKELMDSVDNPTKAAYLKKIVDGGVPDLNKGEAGLFQADMNQRASYQSRALGAQTQYDIAAQNSQREYAKMAQDAREHEKDIELKFGDQQRQYERDRNEFIAKNKAAEIQAAKNKTDHDFQMEQLKQQQEKLAAEYAKMQKDYEAKILELQGQKEIAAGHDASAERRAKISASARRSNVGPKLPPDQQALNNSIEATQKEIGKIIGAKSEITELSSERQKKINDLRTELNDQLDAWKASTGRPHARDLRSPRGPIQGAPAYGGSSNSSYSVSGPASAFGPPSPKKSYTGAVEWGARSKAPVGSIIKTPNGQFVKKTAEGRYDDP